MFDALGTGIIFITDGICSAQKKKKKEEAYFQTNIRIIILTYLMSAACPCKHTFFFLHLGKNHSEECDACVHRVPIPELPLPKYPSLNISFIVDGSALVRQLQCLTLWHGIAQ